MATASVVMASLANAASVVMASVTGGGAGLKTHGRSRKREGDGAQPGGNGGVAAWRGWLVGLVVGFFGAKVTSGIIGASGL